MPATIVFDVQPDAIEMCDESEAEDAEPTRKASPPTKMKGKRALSEMAATPGTADSSRKTKRAMAEQQSAPGSLLPSPAGVALSPTKTPSKQHKAVHEFSSPKEEHAPVRFGLGT